MTRLIHSSWTLTVNSLAGIKALEDTRADLGCGLQSGKGRR